MTSTTDFRLPSLVGRPLESGEYDAVRPMTAAETTEWAGRIRAAEIERAKRKLTRGFVLVGLMSPAAVSGEAEWQDTIQRYLDMHTEAEHWIRLQSHSDLLTEAVRFARPGIRI